MTRKPDADESKAFREAVRDARPLAVTPRVVFRRSDERAVLEESLTLSAADLEIEGGEELSFRRPGVQDTLLRKLRRGHYRVEAEIDLHGLTLPEAKQALRAFLADAARQALRCVRVVHGKGLGSGPRGPVLKSAVNVILRRTDAVVAFSSARPVDGGSGAMYVLLAAPR